MTWLTPWTGWILAAAVIPPLIILYFLRLRRRPQAISCTLLWKRSIEDLRANAPFQKLRKSLLLFLQLLALTLLVFSVMQPQIHAGKRDAGKTVIMIDNSASMTATDGGDDPADANTTRLEQAKRRAREHVESKYGGGLLASSTGQTMIVVFSDRAEIYSRFTDSRQQLLAAIDRIQPTHGQTKIEEAFKLARAYTTNPDPEMAGRTITDSPTLELYSDGRIADLAAQVLRGETLNYHAIGSLEADNVAITGLSIERPYDRPTAIEVFAAVVNFNQAEVICDMQLSVDNQARGIQATTVPAAHVNPATNQLVPGRANVVFTPFEQPQGAVIEIANLRVDRLAADNIAQFAVAPPKKLRVALVSPNRSLIKNMLEGMQFELLEVLAPSRYERLADEGGLENYDVIVLDNYKPEKMPAGRYLTIGQTPPLEGLNEFGEGKPQVILAAKDEHPILRFVSHDRVVIPKFRMLQPADDVEVIWEGSEGPAILGISRGPMHVIHLTFDPLETSWPFQRSFLHFVFNAVEYLGTAGEAISAAGLAPGEALTARLPADATDIHLLTPGSTAPQELKPVDPSQLAWGPIQLAGVHLLTWKAPGGDELQSRPFAVNLLSETEGRIDVNPHLTIGQDQIAGRLSDEAVYTPLWPWAIGVCLAVLMLEWRVYHRKAYI